MKNETGVFDNYERRVEKLNSPVKIFKAKIKSGATEKHLVEADIIAHKNAFQIVTKSKEE